MRGVASGRGVGSRLIVERVVRVGSGHNQVPHEWAARLCLPVLCWGACPAAVAYVGKRFGATLCAACTAPKVVVVLV